MTEVSQSGAASGPVQWAFDRLKCRQIAPIRLVAAGEASFVGGWSMMWASALGLLPAIPAAIWLTLMIAGLFLAGAERLRKPPP